MKNPYFDLAGASLELSNQLRRAPVPTSVRNRAQEMCVELNELFVIFEKFRPKDDEDDEEFVESLFNEVEDEESEG